MNGHWSCTCHTTKYLVDLYLSLLEKEEKDVEINFAHSYQDNNDIYFNLLDKTHLDVAKIFKQAEEKVNI